MPDISYQMRLLSEMQNPQSPMSTMGALREFTGAVGNAWQGYQGGVDAQDAIRYFSEKPVSPESIHEFSTLHPQMPLVEIYKYASTVEGQKKAQKLKDQWKTLQGAIKGAREKGEDFDFSKINEVIPDITPDFVEQISKYKSMFPEAKILEMEPGKQYQRTIGGKFVGDPIEGPPPKAEEPKVWLEDESGNQIFATPSVAAALIAKGKYKKLEKKPEEKDKTPSRYGDFATGFKAKYKREHPNATEEEMALAAADEADKRGIEKAVQITVGGEQAKGAAQKSMLTPEYKETAYQYLKTTGDLPAEIARLFRLPYAQADLLNYIAERQEEDGVTGIDRAANKAFYKGGTTAIATQEKVRGMMGGFVRNINKQVDRVDEIVSDLGRLGFRALDLPIRELKTRAVGSGAEKTVEAYLIEISSEISKLSSGSAASVAQLPVETQKMWNKIHDPNLSLGELKKILAETKTMANMRLTSQEEELENTEERLRKRGGAAPLPAIAAPKVSDIVKKGTFNGKTVYKLKNGSTVYEDGTPVR